MTDFLKGMLTSNLIMLGVTIITVAIVNWFIGRGK